MALELPPACSQCQLLRVCASASVGTACEAAQQRCALWLSSTRCASHAPSRLAPPHASPLLPRAEQSLCLCVWVLAQGVFCGDCLFMRYGENVEEVNANPSESEKLFSIPATSVALLGDNSECGTCVPPCCLLGAVVPHVAGCVQRACVQSDVPVPGPLPASTPPCLTAALPRLSITPADWVCPVCRDLCNCSFHRIKKGWAPTGTLYRAAMREGERLLLASVLSF